MAKEASKAASEVTREVKLKAIAGTFKDEELGVKYAGVYLKNTGAALTVGSSELLGGSCGDGRNLLCFYPFTELR